MWIRCVAGRNKLRYAKNETFQTVILFCFKVFISYLIFILFHKHFFLFIKFCELLCLIF